jgi:hypothetical protein
MKPIAIPSVQRTPKLVIAPLRLTKIISGTRKIFLAIPARDGSVKIDTMMCILDGFVDALIEGWAFDVHPSMANPISAARNLLLAQFAASDCDEIVYLDWDIGWPAKQLIELLKYDVDFVGAVPPHRSDAGGFPVRWDSTASHIAPDPKTGLIKIEGMPMAFARITRRAVEAMIKAYSHLEYDHPGAPNNVAWRLFSFDLIGRGEWSEDMMFCRRFREIGGEVWIDPTISFSHIGPKRFVGSVHDHLTAQPGFEDFAEQNAQYHERVAVGT